MENNILSNILSNAPSQIVSAIKGASEQVGVSFSYLVEQAQAESSFDASAEASTSSATGLYQFIESTWLSMVDKYGEKYGIDTESASKEEILDMRKDPKISCYMAAEFANENARCLENGWAQGVKDIGSTELYFAHFMGAGGAVAFLNARDADGSAIAADLFPSAAKANKNVFYDSSTGEPRSMDEVYAFFDKKFSGNDISTASLLSNSESGSIQLSNESTDTNLYHSLFTNSAPSYARGSGNSYAALMAMNNYSGGLHNLVSNPIELMMLTQLDVPFTGSDSDASSLF